MIYPDEDVLTTSVVSLKRCMAISLMATTMWARLATTSLSSAHIWSIAMVLRHSTPTTHSVVQWRGQQRLCGRRGGAAYRVCTYRWSIRWGTQQHLEHALSFQCEEIRWRDRIVLLWSEVLWSKTEFIYVSR